MVLSGLLINETLNHRLEKGSVHLITTSPYCQESQQITISLNLVSSGVFRKIV